LSAVTVFQMYVSIHHLDLDIGGSKFVPRRPNSNVGGPDQEYVATAGAARRISTTTRNDRRYDDNKDYFATSPPLASSAAGVLVQKDERTIVASQRLDKKNEKDKTIAITPSSTITTTISAMRSTTTQPQLRQPTAERWIFFYCFSSYVHSDHFHFHESSCG
jgi:hypothetical protein